MKSIMLAVLLAGALWATDESADRAAIAKTIGQLNAWPASPMTAGLFTADFDDRAELARELEAEVPIVCPEVWRETCGVVLISKEPWGEATVSMPGSVQGLRVAIVAKKIRFVTPDVVMVDATGRFPALIVLRKEGTVWKIASLRILSGKVV